MGMFDSDLGKPFTEHFKMGDKFTLTGIEVGPVINTSYGESQIVFLTIGGERYGIFGQGLIGQARSMAPSDLPCEVMLIDKATKTPGQRVKLLVPAGDLGAHTSDPVGNDDDIPF